MKKIKWLRLELLSILMIMSVMSSCESENALPEVTEANQFVEVGLKCAGEILKTSESSMSRAEGDVVKSDYLYAIKVYAVTGTEENPTYTNYAYGVFNSLDNVVIRLLQGQKYKFKVSVGVDGGSGNYYYYTDNGTKYVYNADTEFTYSQSDGIVDYHMHYNGASDRVKFDSFYGELDLYEPTTGGYVEIQTKRVAYGVKYITKNLTEGTLKVEVNTATADYDVELTSAHTVATPHEGIYSFTQAREAWIGSWNMETQSYENYHRTKNLTISWTKNDGTVIPLGTHDVTFKRNVMTTVTIDVKDTSIHNGIKITLDDTPMVDDDVQYEISGGTVIETPVVKGN